MDKTRLSFSDMDADLLLKAVNASASGIIITNNQQPDNPIVFCNDKFIQMTGMKLWAETAGFCKEKTETRKQDIF